MLANSQRDGSVYLQWQSWKRWIYHRVSGSVDFWDRFEIPARQCRLDYARGRTNCWILRSAHPLEHFPLEFARPLNVAYGVDANCFSAHADVERSAIGSSERRNEPLEEIILSLCLMDLDQGPSQRMAELARKRYI